MSVPLRHAHRPAATGITLSFLAFLAGMAVPARAEVLRFHSPTHPVPVAAATARVWAVDRDRDGDDDLLIEDRATGQLAWIESLGQWQFGLPSALGVVAPRALLFVPADHGGAVDLVGVDELGRLTSRDVRRNGLPGSPHPLRPESFGPLLAIADLDADGRSEIVGIDASGSILIVLGRRAGPG